MRGLLVVPRLLLRWRRPAVAVAVSPGLSECSGQPATLETSRTDAPPLSASAMDCSISTIAASFAASAATMRAAAAAATSPLRCGMSRTYWLEA